MGFNMPTIIHHATDAFKLLNGVFCIYKPTGLGILHVNQTLKKCLALELNELETRPPRNYVKIEGSLKNPNSNTLSLSPLSVSLVPNLADTPLVAGPRYQPQDIPITWASPIGFHTSGLCVMGIGRRGCWYVRERIHANKPLRKYQIEGRFGIATDNFHVNGKVVDKSSCKHLTRGKLDAVLSSVQAAHQANSFKLMGLPLASQEAYEMAANESIVKPMGNTSTIIYGVKCVQFDMPSFTLELQCINESEQYFLELIHDLGIRMKACAVTTKIRQTAYGKFDVSKALLRKHWTIENVVQNIGDCKEIADDYYHLESSLLSEKKLLGN